MTAGEQLTVNLQRWFAGADSLNLSHVLAHHRKAASRLVAERKSGCKVQPNQPGDFQGVCQNSSAAEPSAEDAEEGVAGGSSGGNLGSAGVDSSVADAAAEDGSGLLSHVLNLADQQESGGCQGGGKGGHGETRDTEGSTRGRDHEVGVCPQALPETEERPE